jgi:hypothetical protein
MMTTFRSLALGAIVTVSVAALTGSASARIVCNEEGDCWHSKTVEVFPPALGLTIHEDNWKWAEGEKKQHWREHEGKGYWKGDKWREE